MVSCPMTPDRLPVLLSYYYKLANFVWCGRGCIYFKRTSPIKGLSTHTIYIALPIINLGAVAALLLGYADRVTILGNSLHVGSNHMPRY